MNPILDDDTKEVLVAYYTTGMTPKQVKKMWRLAP